MHVQAALQAFLLQLEADGRSPHTIGQYRRHGAALVAWLAAARAPTKVAKLTPDVLARFFAADAAKNSCRGGPKKAVSLNAMRTSIRCFAAHLHQSGLLATNPARLLLRARCAPPPPRALHADEQKRLLDVLAKAKGTEAERDRMLVELLLGTGTIGHEVARSTIAKVLKDHGLPPSKDRPTSWRTFLKAHADTIVAMDFFNAEVWTARGLVTHYVLFALHHASRLVEIAGVTTNPDAAFLAQIARNLTDGGDGFLRDRCYVILDRDSKFTAQFRRILDDAGVKVVATAFQAPNMNALAERFVQSIKRECLERLILFGADHLHRALKEFVAHYHFDRPHQGLGNRVLTASASESPKAGEVVVDERLGGLLRSYRRVA